MPSRIVDAEHERVKRDLRQRIGRLRRRIDAGVRAAENRTRRLTSWRTYVKHYPGSAITAALGVGLALSAGLGARRLSRWLGMRMIRRAADRMLKNLWQEVVQIWIESSPKENVTESSGAGDGRQ